MTFLRNMNIRAKLFLGFALVLAITVFIALFGIANLTNTNNRQDQIRDYPILRVNLLNQLLTEVTDLRRLNAAMSFRIGYTDILNSQRNEYRTVFDTALRHLTAYETNLNADTEIDPNRRAVLLREAVALRGHITRFHNEVLEGMFNAASRGIVGDPESRAAVEEFFTMGIAVFADITRSVNTIQDGAQTTVNNRTQEIDAAANLTMIVMIVATVFGVILGMIIAVLVSGMVTNPIKLLTKALSDMASGDLSKRVPETSTDEVGMASRSYNQSMNEFGKLIASVKQKSADLADIGNNLASNMTETAAAMNEISANIQSVKGRVLNQSASVTETNATMEQVTINISKLSEQVDLQTQAVSQSSTAIEEMIANIQSVNTTLARNATNVKELQDSSEVGKTSLQDVAADIQEIARESEGLMEINAVMENIASQTNLLSMNAAIEAAHAGDVGRGFAVVADEIRKLAESSSEQSKSIGTVLKKIKDSMDKITRATDNVLGRFETIDQSVRTVAEQEEIIRNAMEEQSQGSKQVLSASSQVGDVTQQVRGGATEMLEGSKEVIQESKNLERVTQEITNGINEMAAGAEQVNKAVNAVNDLTGRTKENIASLVQSVSGFKV